MRKKSGVEWTQAPTELTRRSTFTEIYGDTSTGRTTLALTSPGPVALIHASEKLEGIVQPFTREGKDIRLHDFGGVFEGGPKKIALEAGRVVEAMREAWRDAFGWARTVILDTHSEAWILHQLSHFGTQTPKGRAGSFEWASINADWLSFLKSGKHQNGLNVVLIGQTKDEYKGLPGKGQRTGKTIRAGQRSVPVIADLVLRTHCAIASADFSVEIQKPWWNAEWMGEELTNEMMDSGRLTLPEILGLITETDAEEWE